MGILDEEADPTIKNDGQFWMEIDDFYKYFYCTTICHFKPNYEHFTVADTHSDIGHAVSRLDVLEDIEGHGVTILLSQMHKRFSRQWPTSNYQYAPMQLYLARIAREELPKKNPKDKDMWRDTLKLVDGARDTKGAPVIYFSRTKLRKGRYILFYRAAWSTKDQQTNSYFKGGKSVSDKIFCQESHKLVLSMQAPDDSQVKLTRLSTTYYDKYLFLQMKQLYVSKFENELWIYFT